MGCMKIRKCCFVWVVLVLTTVAAILNREAWMQNSYTSFDYLERNMLDFGKKKKVDDEPDDWKQKYDETAKRMEQIMTQIQKGTESLQLLRNKTLNSTKSMFKLKKENEELQEKVDKLIKNLEVEDSKCLKVRRKTKRD